MTGRRNVFFYGTLEDPDILRAILGSSVRRSRLVSGVLADHRRVYVRNQPYPMIFPEPGAQVAGHVFMDCSAKEWARLCAYEDNDYTVQQVGVETSAGLCTASVFMGGPLQTPSQLDWDLKAWQRRKKRTFMRRCFGKQG